MVRVEESDLTRLIKDPAIFYIDFISLWSIKKACTVSNHANYSKRSGP